MIKIPSTDKKFSQPNRGDVLGSFWSTWNIDLQDNLGAIRVGNRLKIMGKTGDSGLTNLGVPVAFTEFYNVIACIAGSRIFFSSAYTPNMTFSEDASTNAHTNYSSDSDDLCNFNSTLCSLNCTAGKIYSLDAPGGTWTQRVSVIGGGVNGLLAYFQKFNRLYVVSGGNIHSCDTTWTVSTTGTPYDLTFTNNNDGGNIQCVAPASDRIWIGMKKTTSNVGSDNYADNPTCSIYEWDGISNQVTKEYKIPTIGVMSIIMRRDIPIVIDTEGVLREFDGQGFKEIGRLPLQRGQSLIVSLTPAWTQNFIHPRGLAVTKDNTILALINNKTTFGFSSGQIYDNLPSGIWEFDGNGNASHRNAFTLMPISSTSVTDHGQNKVNYVGSLGYIRIPATSAYGFSTLFAGAEYFTDASSTKDAIFVDAPTPTTTSTYPEGQKYGYFVTPFMQSSQVLDTWKSAFVRYRQFLNAADKIIVKYRTTKSIALQFTLTWVSGTSFTTTTDLSSYINQEVEVLQGTGSGKCSHIVSVVNNSGIYTVTVDETYTGVGTSTAKARVLNFIKASFVADQVSEAHRFVIGENSARIQIKVCMQFTGDNEVDELAIVNDTQQPLA